MKDVANALNMPYTTYINYEKGYREPHSEVLIQIAKFFNVTVDYLINNPVQHTKKSDPVVLTPTQKEFIELLDAIPEDKQQMLLQMIKALDAGM